MEAGDVRAKLGPDKIIGVSAQTVEQALLAEKHGADSLGVGAVFATGSKDDAKEVEHETLKAICEAVKIPVIAIGGITKENVKRTGRFRNLRNRSDQCTSLHREDVKESIKKNCVSVQKKEMLAKIAIRE